MRPSRLPTFFSSASPAPWLSRQAWRPWLQLIRAPNIFTAFADVAAGAFVVFGWGMDLTPLVSLLFCTGCLYAAGCIFNDLADRDLDALERPDRPLPSGRISPAAALCSGLFFLALGWLVALLAGRPALLVSLVLGLVILAYNFLTKTSAWLGPLTMGLCRGLNLLLGMSLAWKHLGVAWTFVLINGLYVFGITWLSRYEVENDPGPCSLVLIVWCATLLCLTGLFAFNSLDAPGFILYVAFVLWTGRPLFKLFLHPAHFPVGLTVKQLILAIPILDGIYAAGLQGYMAGLLVAVCLVPALYLSSTLQVT